MKCERCGREMVFIYKGVWVNERTQIMPSPICPNVECTANKEMVTQGTTL